MRSDPIRYAEFVKVAAYQGPLLDLGVPEALNLVREQVRKCEAKEVRVLCCPEGFLGGLADYNGDPTQCTIRSDDLDVVLAPLTSEAVTTIIGFSELAGDGKLYNAAAVCQRGGGIGLGGDVLIMARSCACMCAAAARPR